MIIYKIQNIINGKCYVGQTIRKFDARIYRHKYDLFDNKHFNIKLQNAWNKYGEDKFIFEQIDTASTISELNSKEIEWAITLDSYNNGYNIRKCGGSKGKQSKETKEKLSKSRKGRSLSEEHKQKISKSSKGRVFSKEHKQKLSLALIGNTRSLGRVVSEKNIKNLRTRMIGNTYGKSNKDNIPSEISKKKMSIAHMGKIPWNKGTKGLQVPWNKGARGLQVAWNKGARGLQVAWNKGTKGLHVAWNKGKVMSEETKQKMSVAAMGNKNRKRKLKTNTAIEVINGKV